MYYALARLSKDLPPEWMFASASVLIFFCIFSSVLVNGWRQCQMGSRQTQRPAAMFCPSAFAMYPALCSFDGGRSRSSFANRPRMDDTLRDIRENDQVRSLVIHADLNPPQLPFIVLPLTSSRFTTNDSIEIQEGL
ncbi:hypothetical protein BC832DRAFT_97454 [Gaertneriomyces semiglobifer]|nr:hypothetical protein BC832DRAFT_97454 [Gaertneriomyces semiglobifer]